MGAGLTLVIYSRKAIYPNFSLEIQVFFSIPLLIQFLNSIVQVMLIFLIEVMDISNQLPTQKSFNYIQFWDLYSYWKLKLQQWQEEVENNTQIKTKAAVTSLEKQNGFPNLETTQIIFTIIDCSSYTETLLFLFLR